MDGAGPDGRVRLAQLMAALSLAADLGLGQPPGRELGVCLAAGELAGRLGCEPRERSEVHYVALLLHVGCTAAARDLASWAGGDDIGFHVSLRTIDTPAAGPAESLGAIVRRLGDGRPATRRARLVAEMLAAGGRRFERMAEGLCEAGRALARGLEMPDGVVRALGQATTRWDGAGIPAVAGEGIARPMRIVRVAHDLVAAAGAASRDGAVAALRRRRGRGYDPAVVDAALDDPDALLRAADAPDAWERVVRGEPAPARTIAAAEVSSVARAFGEFADVKVAFLAGHSARVAALAAAAAESLGRPAGEAAEIRAAGLMHDLGRVAVPNGIWEAPRPLGAAEWERVRLHPYYTERVLERAGPLAGLATLAGGHHERLDGSGYHRASRGPHLGTGARLLAAADAWDAMTHDRPHRPALGAAAARAALGGAAREGALDGRAVDAVLAAAGERPLRPPAANPAGLTDREVEVLRLIAQGRTSREIARALVISEKTAGHHVEHIYAKTGVSTRVGATLFAMRHDLIA